MITYIHITVCKLGLTQWNQNSFEFKLMIPDFPHNIRIRLARLKFFLLRPDITKSLPCWLSQFRKAKCNVRMQQKKIQLGQSYSYIMRKVWYHQIWIQTYLGFIELILQYMSKSSYIVICTLIRCSHWYILKIKKILKIT